MPKKYLLCPGMVTSRVAGQTHFVDEHQLAKLYGVRMEECEVRPDRMFARFGWQPTPGLIRLEPRRDGKYVLPEDNTR